jgi:DNA-binding transcriptional MerR regulator
MTETTIPNRPAFRAHEVCDIAELQPYVLRSWEAEFPDLGISKGSGARIYRRGDVLRVLRLKHLLFVDGLTLAGARKRLSQERPDPAAEDPVSDADVAALVDDGLRRQLQEVRQGLSWILSVMDRRQPTASPPAPAGPRPARSAGGPSSPRRGATVAGRSAGRATKARPARPARRRVRVKAKTRRR